MHASLGNEHASGKGCSRLCSSQQTITSPGTECGNGVSPSCCHNSPESRWYLMRASYGQEHKAADYLSERGFEVFCPKWKKERTYAGKTTVVEVSIIPNVLFVKATEAQLRDYVGKAPLTYFHHYYRHEFDDNRRKIGTGRKPITIPDVQMNSFMLWVGTDSSDKIFLEEQRKFQEGDYVKIREGSFAGFTGYVTRFRRQTRVAIAIESVGTIFTAYIPKNLLIKVEESR